MNAPLLGKPSGWPGPGPVVRLDLQLRAAGRSTTACVWCIAVGSVGVLGHGVAGDLAIAVLGATALSARSSFQDR
jgi:hypothetical protein